MSQRGTHHTLELEKAIIRESKSALKEFVASKRLRETRYTSIYRHEHSEYIVEKGSILHLAVLYDKPNVVKYLLEKRCDIDDRAEAAFRITYRVGTNLVDAPTPLHLAILLYREKIVELLLRSGADPSAAAQGERLLTSQGRVVGGNAVHLCVLWGRLKAMRTLLRFKPTLAEEESEELLRTGYPKEARWALQGGTAVHLAVLFSHSSSLEELLRHTTDVNAKCKITEVTSDHKDKTGQIQGTWDFRRADRISAMNLSKQLRHTTCQDMLDEFLAEASPRKSTRRARRRYDEGTVRAGEDNSNFSDVCENSARSIGSRSGRSTARSGRRVGGDSGEESPLGVSASTPRKGESKRLVRKRKPKARDREEREELPEEDLEDDPDKVEKDTGRAKSRSKSKDGEKDKKSKDSEKDKKSKDKGKKEKEKEKGKGNKEGSKKDKKEKEGSKKDKKDDAKGKAAKSKSKSKDKGSSKGKSASKAKGKKSKDEAS